MWGGAAGAMPVLIGWSAVTGSLSAAAGLLLFVVSFWTLPHFWALAMRFREDYARAGVPMLPVVTPVDRVVRQIVVYTWVTVGTSLLVWPVATSWAYGVSAVLLGATLLHHAHRLRARPDVALRFFDWWNTYLALLFSALALDALIL